MTAYTPNYNLDLYEDSDKPNLRDQYNSAMGKVDTELKTLADSDTSTGNLISGLNREIASIQESVTDISETAQDAQTTANAAQTTASAAQTAASSAATAASEAQSTASAAQSAASTALGSANTAQSTAESAQTTASAAQTTANAAQTAASSAATAASEAQTTASAAQSGVETANTAIGSLEHAIFDGFQTMTDSANNTNYQYDITYAYNSNKTIVKMFGRFTRKSGTGTTAINVVAVPGLTNVNGIKTNIQTGITGLTSGYVFPYCSIKYDASGNMNSQANAWAIGSDGFIYIHTTSLTNIPTASANLIQDYLQFAIWLGVPFTSSLPEEVE